ncbi:hypothetical protein CIK05_00920 [Bdellovibrio sp. qaytius]|nr:hypothetical protein CIK05_00920 [Bdellovibrio sp. qaytius]
MKKNELLLDKLSLPQNHPLYIAMQAYKATEKEIHIDDLIKRVQRKRRSINSLSDEARILKAVGILIHLGKLKYYKGFIYRDAT